MDGLDTAGRPVYWFCLEKLLYLSWHVSMAGSASKTACGAVLFSCGHARVSVAYVRDMLAFPVATETTMMWLLVVMLAARLNPCPEQAEWQWW